MPDAPRTETFSARVGVSYAQIYLMDTIAEHFEADIARGNVGLIHGRVGFAHLVTGLHTGSVAFTVVVATSDPGPDLSYEDIVEADFTARTDELRLHEWGGEGVHPLPRLPQGPGSYRLRYHGQGMDAAHAGGVVFPEDPAVDSYLLQIWPAPVGPPAILRSTSRHAVYWQGGD